MAKAVARASMTGQLLVAKHGGEHVALQKPHWKHKGSQQCQKVIPHEMFMWSVILQTKYLTGIEAKALS